MKNLNENFATLETISDFDQHGGLRLKIDKNTKSDKPLLTIITATFNSEKYLEECLLSLYNQKFSNYEVLLIDNNSNDGTIDLVKKNFPKVKILKFKPKTFFPGQALNFGASKSKGDYLVFISGHCIPKNDSWLSFLINLTSCFFTLPDKGLIWLFAFKISWFHQFPIIFSILAIPTNEEPLIINFFRSLSKDNSTNFILSF